MKNLKAKLQKKGGFTLIEMLIVVAIIAILIAISIPLVGQALDRVKHATDAANERAAKAEILIMYLNNQITDADYGAVYYYDAPNGTVSKTAPTTGTASATYGQHKGHKLLALKIAADGTVTMQWDVTAADAIKGDNLCSLAKDVAHS